MVPFEAFSIDEPQSSSAFCKGCDGGTQCDSRSSKVLSWADAAPAAITSAAPSAIARSVMKFLPVALCSCALIRASSFWLATTLPTPVARNNSEDVPALPELVPAGAGGWQSCFLAQDAFASAFASCRLLPTPRGNSRE